MDKEYWRIFVYFPFWKKPLRTDTLFIYRYNVKFAYNKRNKYYVIINRTVKYS